MRIGNFMPIEECDLKCCNTYIYMCDTPYQKRKQFRNMN